MTLAPGDHKRRAFSPQPFVKGLKCAAISRRLYNLRLARRLCLSGNGLVVITHREQNKSLL